MKQVIIGLIRFYQKYLSPDHAIWSNGNQHVCRFNPTCSEYTVQAVEKYGIVRGLGKGSWRILRCNPWNKGGNDPLI